MCVHPYVRPCAPSDLLPCSRADVAWQAKSDLDGKKVRLAKLRGTPGLKEEKIAEAERDVNEADQRLQSAKWG